MAVVASARFVPLAGRNRLPACVALRHVRVITRRIGAIVPGLRGGRLAGVIAVVGIIIPAVWIRVIGPPQHAKPAAIEPATVEAAAMKAATVKAATVKAASMEAAKSAAMEAAASVKPTAPTMRTSVSGVRLAQ